MNILPSTVPGYYTLLSLALDDLCKNYTTSIVNLLKSRKESEVTFNLSIADLLMTIRRCTPYTYLTKDSNYHEQIWQAAYQYMFYKIQNPEVNLPADLLENFEKCIKIIVAEVLKNCMLQSDYLIRSNEVEMKPYSIVIKFYLPDLYIPDTLNSNSLKFMSVAEYIKMLEKEKQPAIPTSQEEIEEVLINLQSILPVPANLQYLNNYALFPYVYENILYHMYALNRNIILVEAQANED